VADVFCNNCGHKNPLGSNFCSSCGAIIEPETTDSTTITFHPTSPAEPIVDVEIEFTGGAGSLGVLVVKRGQNAGSRFAIARPVTTAGRHPDSDIFLDDVTVSRRHAEILADADGFRVRDVGSLNGTYVNRERIDEAPLVHGDELQIGKFKLVFLLGGADDD
jgi:hypothetical protein